MLVFTVPSVPVGLEANYISSSALLVKWQPPLFPNGNITKYIVKYDLSAYSPWEQDLDWCNRQVFVSRREDKDNTDKGNGDKNPDGKKIGLFIRTTAVFKVQLNLCLQTPSIGGHQTAVPAISPLNLYIYKLL